MTTELGLLVDDETLLKAFLQLRRDTFAGICKDQGLRTIASIAKTINLSERTVDRVINSDDNAASDRFVAHTLGRWPYLRFNSLFAVVDETTGKELR